MVHPHVQSGPADPAGELEPGFILDGKYVIDELIGSGGMGFIYRARNVTTQLPVAVKVMRDELRRQATSVKRFKREAETVRKLFHPNTITIHDYGKSPEGFLYIAMEWLEGIDLADRIIHAGLVPPLEAAEVGAKIARALSEAHSKGIIHRDLKPENVFLVRPEDPADGVQVKVLDFGIAKLVDAPAKTQITRMGMICGTPDFMSPEQARGEALDGRSDVYSLGCMLFTIISGDVPFPAPTPIRVVMRHQLDPFPPFHSSVPLDLAEIIYRATQKKPDERWPDAASMAAALEGFYRENGSGVSELERMTLPAMHQMTREEALLNAQPTYVDSELHFAVPDAEARTDIGIPSFDEMERAMQAADSVNSAVSPIGPTASVGVGDMNNVSGTQVVVESGYQSSPNNRTLPAARALQAKQHRRAATTSAINPKTVVLVALVFVTVFLLAVVITYTIRS